MRTLLKIIKVSNLKEQSKTALFLCKKILTYFSTMLIYYYIKSNMLEGIDIFLKIRYNPISIKSQVVPLFSWGLN